MYKIPGKNIFMFKKCMLSSSDIQEYGNLRYMKIPYSEFKHNFSLRRFALTFWRRIFFSNFNTPCI